MPTDTCHAGEIGESLFLTKALLLGYEVLRPFGYKNKYDWVVEHAGRFARIQVKYARVSNASRTQGGKYPQFCFKCANGNAGRFLGSSTDFVVCHAAPGNRWWVIPISECGNLTKISIPVATLGSPSKWAAFSDRWDLLDAFLGMVRNA